MKEEKRTLNWRIYNNDSVKDFPNIEKKSIDLVYTSPNPFRLIDINPTTFGIGTERTLDKYFKDLATMFDNVRPVLKDKGVIWLNMSDIHHPVRGNLMMIPYRFALFMEESRGWLLRNILIWHREGPDEWPRKDLTRFRTCYEQILVLTKQKDQYLAYGPIGDCAVFDFQYKKPTSKYESGFPPELVEMAILSSCPPGGVVLDPLCGSGLTGVVALKMDRGFIGIDIYHDDCDISAANCNNVKPQWTIETETETEGS